MPIKKLYLLFIAVFIFVTPVTHAQITMEGKVEGDDEALSFANISLFAHNDSVTPVAATLTDLTGSYKITDLRPGRYTVRINYIGYNEYIATLSLRMPSGDNTLVRDFKLTSDPTALKEVTVSANRNTVYADHTKYTFTNEQKERARFSADLLENVGDLTIDPISGNLTKMSGGDVAVLINGVNATISDLKSIPADKIRYVEYYTIPSARYSASAVVNVVTKTLDNGLNGGFDVSQGVNGRFTNGDIYLRGISGNNQLVVNYRLNYRNYKDKISTSDYTYFLSEGVTDYSSRSHAKFGYTTHQPEIKYIYSNPEDISFQASFKPEYHTRFDRSTSDIHITELGSPNAGSGYTDVKTHYFSPSLDLYFSKTLRGDRELAANVVATVYSSKLNSTVNEVYGNAATESFDDEMYRSNSRQSIIGELFYKKKWGENSLSMGYKGQFNHSSSKGSSVLSGYEVSEYRSRSSVNRIYGEYSGNYHRMVYRIGLEGVYISSSNDEAAYTKMYLSPQLIIDWKPGGNHDIIFNVKTSPSIPVLSQLSDNAEFVTANLINTGNPDLRSGMAYVGMLGYKYSNNLLDLTAGALYSIEENPIVSYYYLADVNDREYIFMKESNARSMANYGGVFSGKISLLSDRLSFRFMSLVLWQRLKDKESNRFHHVYCPTTFQLSYVDRSWGVSYSFSIPSTGISGSTIMRDETSSNLSAYYQYGNFRFTGSCLWFLTKAKYEERLLGNALVRHTSRTWINDNRSMVTIGVSWNFSTGKKKDFTKQLNNSDSDKSAF